MASNHSSKGKPMERRNAGAASVESRPADASVEESADASALIEAETSPANAPAPPAVAGIAFSADSRDAADWAQKSVAFWTENMTAFFDFAARLGQARSLDEIASLQTAFASERLDSFLRQSREMTTFAQGVMMIAAPFRGARAA